MMRDPEWTVQLVYDNLAEVRIPKAHLAIHEIEVFIENHVASEEEHMKMCNYLDDLDSLIEVVLDYIDAVDQALGITDRILNEAIRERRLIDKEVDNA